jgi:hypothetical protein
VDQSNTDKLREEDEGEGRHLIFEQNHPGREKRELNLYSTVCVGRLK